MKITKKDIELQISEGKKVIKAKETTDKKIPWTFQTA